MTAGIFGRWLICTSNDTDQSQHFWNAKSLSVKPKINQQPSWNITRMRSKICWTEMVSGRRKSTESGPGTFGFSSCFVPGGWPSANILGQESFTLKWTELAGWFSKVFPGLFFHDSKIFWHWLIFVLSNEIPNNTDLAVGLSPTPSTQIQPSSIWCLGSSLKLLRATKAQSSN